MTHDKAQLAQRHRDNPKIKSNDMEEVNQFKNTMTQFKLNKMTYGRVQLNQRNCGNAQIKSNDLWQTSINSKTPWQS